MTAGCWCGGCVRPHYPRPVLLWHSRNTLNILRSRVLYQGTRRAFGRLILSTIRAAARRDIGSGDRGQIIHNLQTRQAEASRHHAAEALIGSAAATLRDTGAAALRDFDELPTPLYATDGGGRIVYFNPACVDFAGRAPTLLVDQWCVSWKLYSNDGAALPHDKCPMAVAIRDGQPVRGAEAVAERPDGERVRFRPFPTPVIDDAGRVIGAVNLLVLTDGNAYRDLLARAAKCRSLAKWVTDKQAGDVLTDMARECERQAAALRLD